MEDFLAGSIVEFKADPSEKLCVVGPPIGQNEAPDGFVWTASMNKDKQFIYNIVPICALAPSVSRH